MPPKRYCMGVLRSRFIRTRPGPQVIGLDARLQNEFLSASIRSAIPVADPAATSITESANPTFPALSFLRHYPFLRHGRRSVQPAETSHARAALVSAATPVRRVGSICGANSGEWLDGSVSTITLASSSDVIPANSPGSAQPSSQ
jgi:hypothetical protein